VSPDAAAQFDTAAIGSIHLYNYCARTKLFKRFELVGPARDGLHIDTISAQQMMSQPRRSSLALYYTNYLPTHLRPIFASLHMSCMNWSPVHRLLCDGFSSLLRE
jgi:hypothetical protein